ncbi:MAG: GNAT family protein [Baekduia sp.]
MLPTLAGARLTLRPQLETDLVVLGSFLGDPSLARWFGQDDADDLRSSDAASTRSEIDDQAFTIEVMGDVAGWMLVAEEPHPDYREAGLDIMLGPAFQDRGLGPEALRLAIRWLFEERDHHRVTIDPAVANARAVAAYRAVGFRDIGIARRSARTPDGDWEDSLLMDLLDGELT